MTGHGKSELEKMVDSASVYSNRRMRLGLGFLFSGYLVFLLGARPSFFGLDRSPVIGFVQTAAFLVGLGGICLGGYFCLMSFWPRNGGTLTADFGLRLVATGYVIAIFTGMADVFGIGSHPLPGVPFFGPLQAKGVELGEGVIAIGLIMMIVDNAVIEKPEEKGSVPETSGELPRIAEKEKSETDQKNNSQDDSSESLF